MSTATLVTRESLAELAASVWWRRKTYGKGQWYTPEDMAVYRQLALAGDGVSPDDIVRITGDGSLVSRHCVGCGCDVDVVSFDHSQIGICHSCASVAVGIFTEPNHVP